ncbi:MAG TPA: hypothetical protein VF146_19460, partial [Bryobacteraceae bacterium]
ANTRETTATLVTSETDNLEVNRMSVSRFVDEVHEDNQTQIQAAILLNQDRPSCKVDTSYMMVRNFLPGPNRLKMRAGAFPNLTLR